MPTTITETTTPIPDLHEAVCHAKATLAVADIFADFHAETLDAYVNHPTREAFDEALDYEGLEAFDEASGFQKIRDLLVLAMDALAVPSYLTPELSEERTAELRAKYEIKPVSEATR